jgi:class 3 adenylate cyclase
VLVSGEVRAMCETEAGSFVALGERHLKGFAQGIPLFRFDWQSVTR